MIRPGDLIVCTPRGAGGGIWARPRGGGVVGNLRAGPVGIAVCTTDRFTAKWIGWLVLWPDGRSGWSAADDLGRVP